MTAKLCRLLIVVMAVLCVFIIPVVWIAVIRVYGSEFSFSRNLFLILLPGSVSWGLYLLLASDIEGRGLPGQVSIVSMLSGLATVGLGVVIIPLWNSSGAAVVSSISHGISMILAFRFYKRMMGVNLAEYLVPKGEDLRSIFKISGQIIGDIRENLSPILRKKGLGL